MARNRINMSKQKEIHRLKDLRHNKSKVARLMNITRETIIKYWDKPLVEE
jgi:hypothetical protein